MENKKRTITLSGRRPVKITEDEWPVIASGTASHHDGEYECQSNRRYEVSVRVRRHADGRTLVYGVATYNSNFQHERDFLAKSGFLLDADADVAASIARTAEELSERASEDGPDELLGLIRESRAECIADLPAEEL